MRRARHISAIPLISLLTDPLNKEYKLYREEYHAGRGLCDQAVRIEQRSALVFLGVREVDELVWPAHRDEPYSDYH